MMTNGNPRLSIITICFNNAEGLRETLNSTLCQQHAFRDFEQIVVDGGSSDSTKDVIHEYEDRLAWWCSEPDNGIYNAMNKGVEHASGDYLLFLNSGDILLEDSLEKVFALDFNEDLVYSDIYTRGSDGKLNLAKSPSGAELTPAYLTINTLPHQATLIRRQLHEALGGYDESMKISAAPKFIMDALIGRKCSSRYLEMAYSVFDRSGISSDPKLLAPKLREWQYFLRPHFGERVAAAFFRAKMSEKIVSKGALEFLEKHPEKTADVRKYFDDSVRDIKHNLRHYHIVDLQREIGSLRLAAKATDAKIGQLQREAAMLKGEIASLKRSSAYRAGMLLTWPLRKIYRGVFCRRKGK